MTRLLFFMVCIICITLSGFMTFCKKPPNGGPNHPPPPPTDGGTKESIETITTETGIQIEEVERETIDATTFPEIIEDKSKDEEESQKIYFHFDIPKGFECGKTLTWKDLENWDGVPNNKHCQLPDVAYEVKGHIENLVWQVGMKIKCEIYVPDADKWWPCSHGPYINLTSTDGKFDNIYFCMPDNGGCDRDFHFQLYSRDPKSGKLLPIEGSDCIIFVRSAP